MIEQGPRKAKNVLVLVPGTSGGAAYFRPAVRDIVAGLPGWKTWWVDRREGLLEDHSVLGPIVARERTAGDASGITSSRSPTLRSCRVSRP